MGRRRRSESSSSSSSEDSEARRLRKERKRLKKEKKRLKKESKKKRRRSKSPERPKIEAGPQRPPPARPSLLAAAMAPLSTGTVQGDRSGSFVGAGWSHGGAAPAKDRPLTGLQRAHRDEGRETALHALARKKDKT